MRVTHRCWLRRYGHGAERRAIDCAGWEMELRVYRLRVVPAVSGECAGVVSVVCESGQFAEAQLAKGKIVNGSLYYT